MPTAEYSKGVLFTVRGAGGNGAGAAPEGGLAAGVPQPGAPRGGGRRGGDRGGAGAGGWGGADERGVSGAPRGGGGLQSPGAPQGGGEAAGGAGGVRGARRRARGAGRGRRRGGFTRVLLEAGARRVYAVDAGHGQLLGSLRLDPRVVNLEATNVGRLSAAHVPEAVEVVTVDVSYLSLAGAVAQVSRIEVAPGGRPGGAGEADVRAAPGGSPRRATRAGGGPGPGRRRGSRAPGGG